MFVLLLAVVGGVFATFCSTKDRGGFFCEGDSLVWCVWDLDSTTYVQISETECLHGCNAKSLNFGDGYDECNPEPCVVLENVAGMCDFVDWYTPESTEVIKNDLSANASVWFSDLDAEFTSLYVADAGAHMTPAERDECVNRMELFACAKFLPKCIDEDSGYGLALENCREPCFDAWSCFEQFGDPNANPLRNMTIFSTRTMACASICAGQALIQVSLLLLAMLMVAFL